MKFGPVVPEICRGQVLVPRKERKKKRKRRRIIIIIIRNGAKTISLQTLFGRLKYTHCHEFWVKCCSKLHIPYDYTNITFRFCFKL